MAIPKKGSRLIVVDGVQYRWRVRGRPTYGQEIFGAAWYLAIESVESKGQVMVVDLPQVHPDSLMITAAKDKIVPVLPSDVEKYIRMGLQAGWRPDQPGKQFLMSIPTPNPSPKH